MQEYMIEGTTFVTFYCSDTDVRGRYYNQLATLSFTGFESAIKQLFYFQYSDEFQSEIYYTVRFVSFLSLHFAFALRFFLCILHFHCLNVA